MARDEFDIMIVGGGPAGCAAALALDRFWPEIARRIVLVDRASFPRHKLCGGGITAAATSVLDRLATDVATPWYADIGRLSMQFAHRTIELRSRRFFRVVDRAEFDHALLNVVRARGIAVHEGEKLLSWNESRHYVETQTSEERYRVKVVVGADGVNGRSRRLLAGPAAEDDKMMALKTVMPFHGDERASRATFDFRMVESGFHGYYWEFPTLHDGQVKTGAGIIDTRYRRAGTGESLKASFARILQDRGADIDAAPVLGCPVRAFRSGSPHLGHRVVLAGDAVGTDALWADGIASALRSGWIAAQLIVRAGKETDYVLAPYRQLVDHSRWVRSLTVRRQIAERLYAGRAPLTCLAADWAWRRMFGLLHD